MPEIIESIEKVINQLDKPTYGEKGDEWIEKELGNNRDSLDREINLAERIITEFKNNYLDMYPVRIDDDDNVVIAYYSLRVPAKTDDDIVYTESFIRHGIINTIRKKEKHVASAVISVNVRRDDKLLDNGGQFIITILFNKKKIEKLIEKGGAQLTNTVVRIRDAPSVSKFFMYKAMAMHSNNLYVATHTDEWTPQERHAVNKERVVLNSFVSTLKDIYSSDDEKHKYHITYEKEAGLFVVSCDVYVSVQEDKMLLFPCFTKSQVHEGIKAMVFSKEPKLSKSIYTIVVDREDQLYTYRQIPGKVKDCFRVSLYLKEKGVRKLLKNN